MKKYEVFELPARHDGGFYVKNVDGVEVYFAETLTDVIAWLDEAGVDFTVYRYMDDKDVEWCDAHSRFRCVHPLDVQGS